MTAGRRRGAAAALGLLLMLVAGCTSDRPRPAGSTTTRTEIETVGTRPPSTSPVTPAAPSTRAPLPPGHQPHAGEKAGPCPYIKAGLDVAATREPNVADIEGDRVGRTTVLTRLAPVGCRFYFSGGGYEGVAYEAIAEIRPQTYANAATAHNAMVLTARTGKGLIVERGFVKGLDGICFQTRFFGPDKNDDWAFVFAKGRVLVTVYTQVTVSSRNALYLAQAIAAKF